MNTKLIAGVSGKDLVVHASAFRRARGGGGQICGLKFGNGGEHDGENSTGKYRAPAEMTVTWLEETN
jgi:hypothetical protein